MSFGGSGPWSLESEQELSLEARGGGGRLCFGPFSLAILPNFGGSTHYFKSIGSTDPSNENTSLRLHVLNLFLL